MLLGGEGDDALYGGGGSDDLTGGAGRDRFVFRQDELDGRQPGSGVALGRILDFTLGEDVIDLSQIDANVNAAGDQAFVFVAAFTGVAGQATLVTGNGVTSFSADLDGDGVGDLVLLVFNATPTTDSFVL